MGRPRGETKFHSSSKLWHALVEGIHTLSAERKVHLLLLGILLSKPNASLWILAYYLWISCCFQVFHAPPLVCMWGLWIIRRILTPYTQSWNAEKLIGRSDWSKTANQIVPNAQASCSHLELLWFVLWQSPLKWTNRALTSHSPRNLAWFNNNFEVSTGAEI